MARFSSKNNKHLAELIDSISIQALRLMVHIDAFACLGPIEPNRMDDQIRARVQVCLDGLPPDVLTVADQEAVRLLALVQFRIEQLLDYADHQLESSHSLIEPQLERNSDVMTRLIWLRAFAPQLFDQIETIYFTHHFHGHPKLYGFALRKTDEPNRHFHWNSHIAQHLLQQVSKILLTDDKPMPNSQLVHFAMDEPRGEQIGTVHYVVIYHPGQMRSLHQLRHRCHDFRMLTSALEATMIYDPSEHMMHVLCHCWRKAQQLAHLLIEHCIYQQVAAESVHTVHYALDRFKRPVQLQAATAQRAMIVDAWIAMITLSFGHTRHTMTLAMANNDNLWDVCQANFGAHHPLARCQSISEVQLSFVVRFDGESQTRALDITLDHTGGCSLHALPDPRMKQCGWDILLSLGLVTRMKPAPVGADWALFQAELQLLDLAMAEVDGYLLAELKVSPELLIQRGLLIRKAPGQFVTIAVQDGQGRSGYRRLPVYSDSQRTWAVDEPEGRQLDLSQGDLCRYGLDLAYLRKRLDALLGEQLVDRPLVADVAEPYLLGFYCLGDQRVPVLVVSHLWEAKHANWLDTRLRLLNLGLCLVLSTTANDPRRFLGPGIVVPIVALVQECQDRFCLDLARVSGEIRRHRGAATSCQAPRLVVYDLRNAMLIGPWPEPWLLTKHDWVAVVKVLVDGWNAGQRHWTRIQLEVASGVSIRSMAELFRGAPEWRHYLRGADGNRRSRIWELNIGATGLAQARYPCATATNHVTP